MLGLFADLKAADRAARSLNVIGLAEDQIEILDLGRLIVEHNPVLAAKMAVGTTGRQLSGVSEELIESLGLEIAEAVDLPRYLIDMGVPEESVSFYAGKIRDGLVLLIASPGKEHTLATKRLLNEMTVRTPNKPAGSA